MSNPSVYPATRLRASHTITDASTHRLPGQWICQTKLKTSWDFRFITFNWPVPCHCLHGNITHSFYSKPGTVFVHRCMSQMRRIISSSHAIIVCRAKSLTISYLPPCWLLQAPYRLEIKCKAIIDDDDYRGLQFFANDLDLEQHRTSHNWYDGIYMRIQQRQQYCTGSSLVLFGT